MRISWPARGMPQFLRQGRAVGLRGIGPVHAARVTGVAIRRRCRLTGVIVKTCGPVGVVHVAGLWALDQDAVLEPGAGAVRLWRVHGTAHGWEAVLENRVGVDFGERMRRTSVGSSVPAHVGGTGHRDRHEGAAADWMAGLPDSLTLGELTVPGTHQSCAHHNGLSAGFTRCQNVAFGVSEQLQAGVRYLDIRCRVRRGELRLHHDVVFQHSTCGEVLACCAAFLRAHPGECIVMRVCQEYSTVSTDTFGELFWEEVERQKLRDRVFLRETVPLLGQVRGGVVITSGPCYVGGIRWADPAVMDLQDNWGVRRRETKAGQVRGHLERTLRCQRSAGTHRYRLFVNHTSGYWIPWLTPRAVAAYVNPATMAAVRALRDDVVRSPGSAAAVGGLGVVVMDFADESEQLIDMLIDWNYLSSFS